MKKIMILSLVFLCGMVLRSGAEEKLTWLTDLSTAQAKAKAEHKLVVMDFTGSDWCYWCKKLNSEIFSSSDFAAYAAKNLVLVEVDFPQAKAQSDALKKANQALQTKFKVEGYPTIIVLNGEGKKVGELGYMEGGPKPFIAQLAKLKG